MSALLVLVLAFALTSGEEISVTIKQGKLIGASALDKNGETYYNFWAIPYAKPPVGNLRFALPEKAEPWQGTYNATYKRPICAQMLRGIKSGVEDCLYVNVHTKRVRKHLPIVLKPVIFYIHGGSYFLGNSRDHGAEYLMQEDVVLVTVNYRLGPFGILSSGDTSLNISGNTQMKDQVLALKWVRDNIKRFGGDPSRVMIMGQSVGGVSVHMHVLSPASAGLFQSAVSMSGAAEMGFSEGAPYSLVPIGRRLGIKNESEAEILEELRKLTTEEVLDAERDYDPNGAIAEEYECSLIVEKNVPGAFLTQRPLDIIKSGRYNQVPFTVGYTNIDGLYGDVVSYQTWGYPRNLTNTSMVMPHSIRKNRINVTKAENELRDFYFGEKFELINDQQARADFMTGVSQVGPLSRVLKEQLRTSKQPIYLYIFSGDTQMNYIKKFVPETANARGAVHCDDLAYIFKRSQSPAFVKGSVEEKAINVVVKMVGDMAKNGKPMKPWKPITKNQFNYMHLGLEAKASVNPDKAAFDFWDKWNEKYFIYQ